MQCAQGSTLASISTESRLRSVTADLAKTDIDNRHEDSPSLNDSHLSDCMQRTASYTLEYDACDADHRATGHQSPSNEFTAISPVQMFESAVEAMVLLLLTLCIPCT
jgi:hypothetical protein